MRSRSAENWRISYFLCLRTGLFRVILLQAQWSLSEVNKANTLDGIGIRTTASDRKAELAATISFNGQCFPLQTVWIVE